MTDVMAAVKPMESVPRSSSSSSSSSSQAHGSAAPPQEYTEITEIRKHPDGPSSTHKYLKGKLLGKGGFAKVYWCTSVDSGKNYAVKIVPKANLVKTRARQKLQAEIKIHRVLKHRRIVEYKHFFEDRTNCYILLELCHNQSMNELIKARKRLTEPEVLYYMSQLLDGTNYMHGTNVIHRDLKLGNLFLDKHMCVKIGDLGLATKLADKDERKKTICGTPNYIAPEIISGTTGHSFQVDIWSMGVIMYTLLVGKPPYESKDVKSTYKRILANVYDFPDNANVSERAKDLIRSMLQSNPEARPTLMEVQNHPFFTHRDVRIPLTLPDELCHHCPTWRENSKGELVCGFSSTHSSTSSSDKVRTKTLDGNNNDNRHRVPLGVKDVNGNNGNTGNNVVAESNNVKARKPIVEAATAAPEGRVTRSKAASAKTTAEAPAEQKKEEGKQQWAFKIYDDYMGKGKESKESKAAKEDSSNANKGSSTRSSAAASSDPVDDLAKQTAAFSLSNGTRGSSTSNSSAFASSTGSRGTASSGGVDSDMAALEVMHQRLSASFAKGTLSSGAGSSDNNGTSVTTASKWVTRYVDYTSKYGLGFLLNDGSAGVYFNDSTKVVLSPTDDVFEYIERRKSDGDRRGDHVRERHTLTNYPTALQKKVILLKHFRNYLVEQSKRSDIEGGTAAEGGGAEPLVLNEEAITGAGIMDDEEDGQLVYLKKWVRTRHAILFRLSNKTVQVVFFDHTEILLSASAHAVTYVDKTRQRSTHSLQSVMGSGGRADIAKRLKYTRDILKQLISSSKR
jgi:polo-like kinase 1